MKNFPQPTHLRLPGCICENCISQGIAMAKQYDPKLGLPPWPCLYEGSMQKDSDLDQRCGLQLCCMLMSLQSGNASSFTQQSAHTCLLWKQSHWLCLFHISIIFVFWDWLDLYSMIVNDIIFGFSVLGAQCRTVPLCFTISIVVNQHWHLKGIGMHVCGRSDS